MYKLLCVILLWFVTHGYAQNNSELNSLLAKNDSYNNQDSIKVKLLNAIALQCQRDKPDKGLQYVIESIEIAKKINYTKGLIDADNIKAVNEFALQQYPNIKDVFTKLAKEKLNISPAGIPESAIGKVYVSLSDYPKAIAYLETEKTFHISVKNSAGVARVCNSIGSVYINLSDLSKALEYFQQALLINETNKDEAALATTYINIGNVFFELEQSNKALENYTLALKINETIGSKQRLAANYYAIGNVYLKDKKYREALLQFEHTLETSTFGDALKAKVYTAFGNVYNGINENAKALNYFQKALLINQQLEKENIEVISNKNALSKTSQAQELHHKADYIINTLDIKSSLAQNYQSIGILYNQMGDIDKAFTCLRLSRLLAIQLHTLNIECNAVKNMSFVYEKIGNYDSAYAYYKNYIVLRDSINSSEKQKEITRKDLQFAFDKKESEYKLQQQITSTKLNLQKSELDRNEKQKELERLAYYKSQAELKAQRSENDKKEILLIDARREKRRISQQQMQQEELNEQRISEQRTIKNSFIGGAALLLVLLIVLINRFRIKQQSEKELNHAYEELKLTQQQLIQQEKLASLGELTAGIAHEIKNPLNFVNNFAQISSELIDELSETENESEKAEILNDVKNNLQKINHHGKRADSIVQNMLQHSRGNTGEKQLTDLNKLCDEYTDLSFHGMRATLQGFQCFINKNFDTSLPKINIIQQDISRVILNILNNAFYAVNKKSSLLKNETESQKNDWKPLVVIATKPITMANKNYVEIQIRDNGCGMPESVKQKIFEPFYTTKSTGEGTGLGLSLSYDIITKEHHGKIEVASEDGLYTEIKIILPV